MNIRSVANVVASLSIVVGFFIASSALVSIICGDPRSAIYGLLVSGAFPVVLGSIAFYFTRGENEFGIREGFGIVTFAWIFTSIFGAIPFMIIMDMYWYDAFFETMSGFTTTGASVLDNTLVLTSGETLKYGIADLPKGLLYWRSMTHWLGGMGIVVLSIAILPFLGIGGHQLYMAETSGADKSNKLTPRIANTARAMWSVYVLITILQTLLLWGGGMTFFEAWCHSCSTIATGGFSTEQDSIAAFDSFYIECVVMLFMFVASLNFALHYSAIIRHKTMSYFEDEEFRLYSFIIIIATVTIAFSLMGGKILLADSKVIDADLANSFRYSAFQVISLISSTGFATADVADWPPYSKLVVLIISFVAACAGSTAGGLKISRLLICTKYSIHRISATIFPNLVRNARFNGERMDSSTMHKAVSFFFIYCLITLLTAIAVSILESSDLETNISTAIACVSNVGPGLGKVSQINTFAWMTPASKMVLSAAMLIGRLEVFTILVVLLPSFWKR